MNTKLYLNLPVDDCLKARDFYIAIGFSSNPEFSNPISESIQLNDRLMLLLVKNEAFKESAQREIADTTRSAETVLALEVDTSETVDSIVDNANKNGGQEIGQAFEHEGMYTRIFRDPYGHQFNVFTWTD